ncbi:hypothetical protein [Paracidovorax sp. MALMAid1276]|uniref:hypothetical protein n=1 Tax=Paracidovorax sp. MALMAid1276 TaxID=3411631 RepID=UPI003B9A25CA
MASVISRVPLAIGLQQLDPLPVELPRWLLQSGAENIKLIPLFIESVCLGSVGIGPLPLNIGNLSSFGDNRSPP